MDSPSDLASRDHEPEINTHAGGRQTRKRKNTVVIYDCICGDIVSQGDINSLAGVIECKRQGCETRWVSARSLIIIGSYLHLLLQFHLDCVGLEHPVLNWVCESCGTTKKRRL